jgi:Zn-finger nucleic acid-binding protein
MACPSCFGMMFLGAKFCPRCAAPAVVWQPDPAEAKCPHCAGGMLHGDVGGLTVHECGACFGLWLDRASFDAVCRDRERQATVLAERPSTHAPGSWDAAQVRYRKCPVCTQLMNRMNYAGCSGVIVDVCSRHGVWFDRNELQRVVAFIQNGGHDRARRREKEELVRERSRLERERLFRAPDSSTMQNVGAGIDVVGTLLEMGGGLFSFLDGF